MNEMKNDERVTELWRLFRRGREYQEARGLTRMLPLCVKFYEGDQWAAPTKNTRNLPRPVVNVTKMICRAKKSAIVSAPMRILYRSWNGVDVEALNRFAAYIQKELGQNELDRRGVECAIKKGTYIYHYYWDATARGAEGCVEGALRCELLDPLNVFFSDPTETDEQKQAWILIASREPVEAVRKTCEDERTREAIRADTEGVPEGTVETDGLVTVLTRYFRRDGEVFCERATRTALLGDAFPITPNVSAAHARISGEDPARTGLPAPMPVRRGRRAADLYPIVVGQYEEREGSIYGMGEVEGIIPNQRAINFNLAMMLLSAQENGWGKYVVGKDALRGQVITNEPGQVLTDFTPGGGGIRRLSDHALPSAPMQIVETLTSLTRSVTGASEIMTGESLGSLSGAAIAQLQSQALRPVEELRRGFHKVKEKQGAVLSQFFRFFYTERRYPSRAEDGRPYEVFDSRFLDGVELEVAVEAVGGTNASVAGDISALDLALSHGAIDLYTYFDLYPREALANRDAILRALRGSEGREE